MTIKIAIADVDTDYVERIMNVLGDYNELVLSAFTDCSSLTTALATKKKYDVLLFTSCMYSEEISLKNVLLPIILTDEENDIPSECKDFVKIYKYQRISQIYKQILENFAKISGKIENDYDSSLVKSIAIYSPIGGVGKTTIALSLAAKLASLGKQVFYLNFEETASEAFYLPQNAQRGISELLGCIGENMNHTMKIQGLLQSKDDNLYYLNHFDTPNDIYEIEEDEMQEILQMIKNTGFFDYIIIDMSCSMDAKNRKLFDLVNKIIIVERTNRMAVEKLKIFYNQAHIINENANKMLRITNFDIGEKNELDVDIRFIGSVGMTNEADANRLINSFVQSPAINFLLEEVK